MTVRSALVDRCDQCGAWLRPMTPEQHAAVEAVYRDLSEQLDWPRGSGIKRSTWVWHQMVVAAYARYKGWHVELLPGIDGVGMEPVYRQKQSRLTVKQGAELKHFARAWAIEQGVQLRDPPEREDPPMEEIPMSMSIGMVYEKWKAIAAQRNWRVPPEGSRLAQPDWHESWINYWLAMEERERKLAAGESDPGRPVVPHRSGGGQRV